MKELQFVALNGNPQNHTMVRWAGADSTFLVLPTKGPSKSWLEHIELPKFYQELSELLFRNEDDVATVPVSDATSYTEVLLYAIENKILEPKVISAELNRVKLRRASTMQMKEL